MTLADLIDLEAQLARDRDADPAALEKRDRALAASRDRGASPIVRWLDALRAAEPGRPWPGHAVDGGLRAVRAILVIAGLLLGWGAATALLRGGGDHPVNVWDFLLAFVGVQLLLLALLVASFFLPLLAAGRPVAGLARALVAAAWQRLAPRAGADAAEWRAIWHRMRSRRSLYHHVEPWLLLATTQGFGVAFNVGALAALLRLVVFTDLSFAWSTTLVELDAPRFHALASALAAPWRALWPAAAPSLDLVAATRYSHLAGAYVPLGGAPASPLAAGGWWPFLVASLATYGLLPRVVLLAVATIASRRTLARLPLDDAEVLRVTRRLAEPHVETRASGGEVAAEFPRAGGARPDLAARGGRCAIVRWRDAPAGLEAAVARQTGCDVAAVATAGGADDPADPPALDGADPIVVLAESWESPDKATLRLLRSLRAAAGPRRHLLVALVDTAAGAPRPPDAATVRLWRDHVAPLEDPFLAVEGLGVAG